MQIEFEKMLGKSVSEADYELIELVYMYHPCSFEKETIVNLFKEFGMVMIKDLVPRSKAMKELEERVRYANSQIWASNQLQKHFETASASEINAFLDCKTDGRSVRCGNQEETTDKGSEES